MVMLEVLTPSAARAGSSVVLEADAIAAGAVAFGGSEVGAVSAAAAAVAKAAAVVSIVS